VSDAAIAIAIGATIGLFSGLFGVGGSSISTPMLRIFLDTPRLVALATPLPATIPTAISGSAAYSREGLINRRVVLWTIAGGVPTMVLGALLTKWVPAHWLMFFIAVGVMIAGVRLATQQPPPASAYLSDQWKNAPVAGLVATAAAIGLISGLLANGGGFLFVPAFVILFGARMREAAATSLPCVAALAVPGTVTHALLGHVDGLLALQLTIGVVPATYLGAQLSLRWREVPLRRPFGVLMTVFGVYFLVTELI
jgi:uncharacterized membrane protein YfcA